MEGKAWEGKRRRRVTEAQRDEGHVEIESEIGTAQPKLRNTGVASRQRKPGERHEGDSRAEPLARTSPLTP